jgi:hypothetical protein
MDFYHRTMSSTSEYLLNLHRHLRCPHTDAFNKLEWKKAVDQELRLFALFDVRIAKVCSLYRFPIKFIEVSEIGVELRITGAGVRTGECPANVVRVGLLNNPIKVCFEVDDWVLSSSVDQFGMICAMDDIEHHRSGAEVKRNILAHLRSWMTGNV